MTTAEPVRATLTAKPTRQQRAYEATEDLAAKLLEAGDLAALTDALLETKPRRAKRPSRVVETPEYAQMVVRIVRAMGRRIGQTGDVECLADFESVRKVLDQAVVDAVTGLRAGDGLAPGTAGYSWAEIAAVLGTTRQAAMEKYTPREPGQPKRVRTRGRTPGTVSPIKQQETA